MNIRRKLERASATTLATTRATTRAMTLMMTLAAMSGCVEETPLKPARQTVKALWDPSAGTLPSPSDLARDPTTGRLHLPIDDAMPEAEQEFRRYLSTLDGYPITSTVSVPVSGPIDPDSLPGALILVDQERGLSLETTTWFDPQRQVIVAQPKVEQEQHRLRPGATYRVGLWGYQGGARGLEGAPLIADAAFYLLRSRSPLTEHLGAMPGQTRQEKEEAAMRLEPIRAEYGPLLDTIARFGPPRDQIAAAATFTTTSRPSIWLDVATGQVPTVNNMLLDPQTQRVSLPVSDTDDQDTRHIKALLATYDGFSTTGAITIRATDEVDPAQALTPEATRVFRVLADGQVVEHTDVQRGVLQDKRGFYVQPRLAFEPDATHVYVVRRGLKTRQGQGLEPQPLAALLRSRSPLWREGRSLVSALDEPTAKRLEPLRQQTAPVLDWLQAREGLERDQIALAIPFKTLDSVGFLMGWRAKLFEAKLRTDVVNTLVASPSDRGLLLVMPSVRTIVTGDVTVMDHLDYGTLAMREDGSWEPRLARMVLTIPRSAKPGEPIPTVIFGHGLMTSRELVYMIAEVLAQRGYAAISMDMPLHGERSVCLQDSNCADSQARCDDQGRCLLPDRSIGDLKRLSSPWPNGPTYPVTSGVPFIDIGHIDAARDHFIQAVLDMTQLIRVARGADWAKLTGGYVLDGQDMMYLGMSLGGILGSILTVVEPTLTDYVLNVPGAGYLDMVQASAAFRSLFDEEIARRGLIEGSDEFKRFLTSARWIVDPVDPVNVVQHATQAPIQYQDPEDGQLKQAPVKRVMIQMATGDSVVPNVSTRILSERMKTPMITYSPTISNHAFLFDPTSGEGRRARQDMLEFFEQRARRR